MLKDLTPLQSKQYDYVMEKLSDAGMSYYDKNDNEFGVYKYKTGYLSLLPYRKNKSVWGLYVFMTLVESNVKLNAIFPVGTEEFDRRHLDEGIAELLEFFEEMIENPVDHMIQPVRWDEDEE